MYQGKLGWTNGHILEERNNRLAVREDVQDVDVDVKGIAEELNNQIKVLQLDSFSFR